MTDDIPTIHPHFRAATIDSDRDIAVAERELAAMASATKLSDLKTAWESILFRLERAWERTERAVSKTGGGAAQSWLSINAKLRRADPLLQYLKQARNAETHSVSSSVASDTVISVTDRFGRSFAMDQVRVVIDGTTLKIELKSLDIGMEWQGRLAASDPKLQAIVVRGTRYNPPRRHLGNRILNDHPVFIATLGIDFYKGTFAALASVQPKQAQASS